MSGIRIRPLTKADTAAHRALRLEGLRLAPEAFSAAYEDEILRSDEEFARRIPDGPPSAIFGAFQGADLVAMTGFLVPAGRKERHKGMIWGVYVSPAGRGQGLAKRLLQAAIDRARTVEGWRSCSWASASITRRPGRSMPPPDSRSMAWNARR
jgi:ribosomal protein S18 acetylase RimI-like enzyme